MKKQDNKQNSNDNQNTQIKLNKMRRMIIEEDKAREIALKLTQYLNGNK